MAQDTITIAPFDETHLEGALALSQAAGWPHRRADWAMVLSLSHGLVALDDAGVVGTTMMTPFGDAVATINMVIVAERMRGRGLGRSLMKAAMRACGERECRLVATQDGLPLYEKLGFIANYAIRQHQGTPTAVEVLPDVNWADAADSTAVTELDALALGMDRRPLLRLLVREGRLAVLRERGRVVGYGALREFGRGEVVGPVVAASSEAARALLAFLVSKRRGHFLRVDTPAQAELGEWLVAHGLADVGGGIAMCRNACAPKSPAAVKAFAVASQALG
jgi:predicted N-acetyltransferase YhbS